jgi:DNA-binding NarL/FixJ family response regulator
MNDLRILIVAEDPLARAGLDAMLADQPGCAVVGRVGGVDELQSALDVYSPDVLVWDLGWDPAAQIEALSDFQEVGIPIVALVSHEADASAARAAGARGILLRDSDAASLLTAAAAVSAGLVVADLALSTAAWPGGAQALPRATVPLTPREVEVLGLLAEGLPNKTIANRLGISEHTVGFHVNSIFGKLGVQSRTEAVIQATRLGLIVL